MLDAKGHILQTGDKVVFVANKGKAASIETGIVTKIYAGKKGEECTVNGHTHVLPHRVLRMDYRIL